MTIPVTSNFPEEIDTDDNMFLVHDSLRVRLLRDYLPGDTNIFIYGDLEVINRFPPTGIITLTEQCSDAELRALSFYYGSKTSVSFDNLELLPGFTDNPKPKDITNITQNVMAGHHNNIKEAVIAIQEFAGKKGEVGIKPLEGTMEERINYLRSIVLVPKAWFSADKTIGLVPLTVEFKDLSFRLGTDGNTGSISYIWDFGDGTTGEFQDLNGGTIQKIYTTPNKYDVKLTVKNNFGEDTVIFPQYINARIEAPQSALIQYIPRSGQLFQEGIPEGGEDDGTYTTPPKIRTPTTLLLDIEIPAGINPITGRTFAGEQVNAGSPIDPIIAYTWSLADDLVHGNSNTARASYSIGGVYDLILRVDTEFGSYRITTYENSIDVVEKYNLWLWLYNGPNHDQVNATEFGLISEAFKIKSTNLMTLNVDQSFLEEEPNEEQQLREFNRNVGFAPRGIAGSGIGGVGLLYWASGAAEAGSAEKILISEFNGFSDTYSTQTPISRPWNWIGMANAENIYFILGGEVSNPDPNTSPTNQTKQTLDLSSMAVSSSTFTNSNYKNGAGELRQNEVTYDEDGDPLQGNMSVYRSTWKDNEGFFLRNQGVGDFFRIKTFYKTSGNTSEPFIDIKKLQDLAGPVKEEGQLATLSKGVYFFNNSGSISAYNPTSSIWETGGSGINSAAFRLLQDNTEVGFDNLSQTLLAASDGDKIVYLSFDYSEKSFIKFNETSLTFSSISSRPVGDQWNMTIF